MSFLDHVRLMARYNDWMNAKIYDAAEHMTADELWRDRGAFFGSIMGTMNHLLVADVIWLKRFGDHPAARPALDAVAAMDRPTALDQVLHSELADLRAARETVDQALLDFSAALDEGAVAGELAYSRIDGQAARMPVQVVLSHLFNHQTHHRGQLSTLFSQAGIDIGVTDVVAFAARPA